MISKLNELRRKGSRLIELLREQPDLLKPQVDAYLAGQAISYALQQRKPYLASRLGWTEATCLGLFLQGGRKPNRELQERIWRFSGVYPATDDQFAQFAEIFLSAIDSVDLMGLLGSPFERQLLKEFGKDPLLTELSALEPYFLGEPWSQHLAGLRVLVIHPFTTSIRQQYETVREQLFLNPKVLPAFELKLIRPPQTIAGNPGELPSWTASLEHLQAEVEKTEFDAAIVGCGAYGLPIGAHIKKLGKVCIHIGGATQVLFGVTGKRWREHPAFRALQTDAWKNPLESERPPNFTKVEDGCYW